LEATGSPRILKVLCQEGPEWSENRVENNPTCAISQELSFFAAKVYYSREKPDPGEGI
jgi:hypothetical protein